MFHIRPGKVPVGWHKKEYLLNIRSLRYVCVCVYILFGSDFWGGSFNVWMLRRLRHWLAKVSILPMFHSAVLALKVSGVSHSCLFIWVLYHDYSCLPWVECFCGFPWEIGAWIDWDFVMVAYRKSEASSTAINRVIVKLIWHPQLAQWAMNELAAKKKSIYSHGQTKKEWDT